jgi:hypothetical protein
LAKGRLEEAAHVLRTLARVNGKVLPKQFYQELRVSLLFGAQNNPLSGHHYFLTFCSFCFFFLPPGISQERLLLQKMMAQQHKAKREQKPGFLDLFLTPNMRKKTLLVTFNW